MHAKEKPMFRKILVECYVPIDEPYQTIQLGRIYEQLITQGMNVTRVYDFGEVIGKLEISLLNKMADVIEKHREIVEKVLENS